jgi:hypothetical protein
VPAENVVARSLNFEWVRDMQQSAFVAAQAPALCDKRLFVDAAYLFCLCNDALIYSCSLDADNKN